jgi:hypothetical protein
MEVFLIALDKYTQKLDLWVFGVGFQHVQQEL